MGGGPVWGAYVDVDVDLLAAARAGLPKLRHLIYYTMNTAVICRAAYLLRVGIRAIAPNSPTEPPRAPSRDAHLQSGKQRDPLSCTGECIHRYKRKRYVFRNRQQYGALVSDLRRRMRLDIGCSVVYFRKCLYSASSSPMLYRVRPRRQRLYMCLRLLTFSGMWVAIV